MPTRPLFKLFAVALLLIGATAQAAPVGAQAAETITGLEVLSSSATAAGDAPRHSAIARCSDGKQIVGGGGFVNGGTTVTSRLAVESAYPFESDRYTDGFVVVGTEMQPATRPWTVTAYAICADPLPGHEIVLTQTPRNSSSKVASTAVCPSSKRALSAGANVIHYVQNPTGGIGLQVARTSSSGDITRAQATERPGGVSHDWSLQTYAVCAHPPQGYEVVGRLSTRRDSEAVKSVSASCPQDGKLLSVGAGIASNAPAEVSLNTVIPVVRQGHVTAFENSPTAQNWDAVAVNVICAS